MQSRSDDWRYNISKQIIANIRTKNAKISHNTSGIANGGVHFDWYFPNLYSNGNVGDDTDAKENKITSGGITYDQALINHLVHDKGYCVDYLGLTGKYFYSIGIDFTRKDESKDNVDYALAQGYKVRLNKIIESYKILMWGCEALVGFADSIHEVPSHLNHIFVFYQELQKRYKRIFKAFSKNNNEFIKRSYEPDSYGLYSLANCFEDGYEYKKPGNHINVIQERPIYQDVFTNMQAPHKLIEQEIAREAQLRQEAVLASPPPPRPAEAPPPAPRPAVAPPLAPMPAEAPPLAPRPAPPPAPRPAPARSVSADTLMRIRVIPDQPPIAKEEERKDRLKGALYGQAIFDALGLTTEFLSRKQAKTFLASANCIDYFPSGLIRAKQENIENFLKDPYGIRKIKAGGDDPYYWIEDIKNPSGGKGDQQTSRWRQLVPKGSPTDDTDQAILKFLALQNAQGDLESAKKNFAKHIVNWWDGDFNEVFGRKSFGLGSNTMEVMAIQEGTQKIDHAGRQQFFDDPVARSKAIWEKNFLEKNFFTQANGALMSISFILQYYTDSLELAQKATQELAKVTHYDPLVSAHCVAYVTMLYKLQNHQGDLSDDNYQKYLEEAFEAGEKILDERIGDYEEVISLKQLQNFGYNYDLNAKMTEWKNQMRKAIFSEIDSEKFEKWEDLELTDPITEIDEIKATKGSQPYDNIGMSHRALSAGFFALTSLRKKINTDRRAPQNALTEICLELMAQGGDTDTNGTVVGSLCGSYLGFSKIPQAMIDGFGKGNDGKGAGNLQHVDKTFVKVRDEELLNEIENIANQKISKLQDAIVKGGSREIPATIIKPILSRQFNQENNFWHNHQKSDGYSRGNDYLVLNKDYKKTGNIDIRAIEKIMAKVISNCQKHLDMKNDEVMRAITLAKKYGGLGNVANSEELLRDSLLTSVKPDQAPQAMLDKFRQFSFLVQRFNEDNGIYSGRKNGKLVGLRLTFVSENAISLWQENSRAIEARGGGAAGGVGAAGGSPPGRAGGAAAGGGGAGR